MAAGVPFPNRLAIVQRQVEQVRSLLEQLSASNPFYQRKLGAAGRIQSLEDFRRRIPFTTKRELVEDQERNPPFGTNLTFPLERYTRCHQTSGSTGSPLRWLDTPESWEWMVRNWVSILEVSGVTGADRVYFAFSFGPFVGFWVAFEAAVRVGCLCFPGGGLSSVARLRNILAQKATVLCCTPSYALRLAEVAREEGLDLGDSSVRLVHVAGEPGGSIPATRQRLGTVWPRARVFDHHGMTEVGPASFACPARPDVLHIMEEGYIPEIVRPDALESVKPGEVGELILTPLGRVGSPLLRYRTGDLVRAAVDPMCACGRSDLGLEGGILGRVDDMVIVRGVNVYPSAVEEIIRRAGGIAEFRVTVDVGQALSELRVEIEPLPEAGDPGRLVKNLEHAFESTLALRVPIQLAPANSLPRFEGKAQRWRRVRGAAVPV